MNNLTRGLVGKYIDIYEIADGCIQVRANGMALPDTILNPERRITHAAITENKHLSAVLAHTKNRAGQSCAKHKVKPVSAKKGYVKTGRQSSGRPSKMDAYYARKSAKRDAVNAPGEA